MVLRSVYIFILFLLCFACKQTQKVVYDPSNITVSVKNDLGSPQQGAQVRMFNDYNAYLNSKNNGEANGFIENVFTDASGSVIFNQLNTDKEYYFLVNYRDRSRFADLDNYDQEFKFSKHLSKGVETYADIELKPAKSIVGFYIPDSLKGYLPVKLYFGNDSIGSLTQSVTSVSGPNQPGLISFRISPGKINWQAVSSQGCLWFGQVQVLQTENFSPIALQECNAGSVTFYIEGGAGNQLPIEITLNSSDFIGTLAQTSPNPLKCFDKKSLTAARPIGKYTYTAVFKRNNCVITDTFSISRANCKIIKLPNCNK